MVQREFHSKLLVLGTAFFMYGSLTWLLDAQTSSSQVVAADFVVHYDLYAYLFSFFILESVTDCLLYLS